MSSIYENINNLYNRKGFIEKYGLEIWTTAIILLIFFFSYYIFLRYE